MSMHPRDSGEAVTSTQHSQDMQHFKHLEHSRALNRAVQVGYPVTASLWPSPEPPLVARHPGEENAVSEITHKFQENKASSLIAPKRSNGVRAKWVYQ